MDIPIIYEDDQMLAVNKPAGLLVHSSGREGQETIVRWLVERYPGLKDVGEDLKISSGKTIFKSGIVHRLDRETSGVLLVAKTQDTFAFLKKQFQERLIKKAYRIIVYGRVKEKEGVIDLPIGRSASDWRKRIAGTGRTVGTTRPAVTRYMVLAATDEYSYLEVYPETGRTHQIRVHLKAIGHPVVCDPLYAPKRECPSVLGRLALHAFAVELRGLKVGALKIEASLPDDFGRGLETLFPGLRVE